MNGNLHIKNIFLLNIIFIILLSLSSCASSESDEEHYGDTGGTSEQGIVQGIWKGKLHQGSNKVFDIALEFTESSNGRVKGYSHISLSDKLLNFGIMEFSGNFDINNNINLKINESEIIEERKLDINRWCIKNMDLYVVGDNITGSWTAPGCIPGTIDLKPSDNSYFIWHEKLPDCPCSYSDRIINKAEIDKTGRIGTWIKDANDDLDSFHPGADISIRWFSSTGGAGQQCTYDSDFLTDGDVLITHGLGAGTPDLINGNSFVAHYFNDVVPFTGYSFIEDVFDNISINDTPVLSTCGNYLTMWPPNQGSSCGGFMHAPYDAPTPSELDYKNLSCKSIIDGFSLDNFPGEYKESDGWKANISLQKNVNSLSGEIEYKGLSCGGTLNLEKSNRTHAIFKQKISYGNCIDSCELHIALDKLSYNEYCNGNRTGSGVFN